MMTNTDYNRSTIQIASNRLSTYEKIRSMMSRDNMSSYVFFHVLPSDMASSPFSMPEPDILIWAGENQEPDDFIAVPLDQIPPDCPVIIIDKALTLNGIIEDGDRYVDIIQELTATRLLMSARNAVLWRKERLSARNRISGSGPCQHTEYTLNCIPFPIFILDERLNIVFANKAIRDVLGKDMKELCGRPCFMFMHDAQSPPTGCPGLILLNNREMDSNKALVIREANALGRKFRVYCVPFEEHDGRIKQIIHLAVDITDMKETEARLHMIEARYLDLLENATDLIQTVDGQGKFLFVNRVWRETLGYDLNDLRELTIFDILKEKDWPHSSQLLQDFSKNDKEKFIMTKFVAKTGEEIEVEGFINTKVENGKFLYTRGIFRNITTVNKAKRKAEWLQAQLLQSQKMEAIGRLAGGLAHDFNNMLTVILGYAQLVMMGMEPGDRQYARMREIESAAEKAQALTRQVLAFSRKQMLKPEITDMNLLLGKMENMLQHLLGEDVDINMELDPDLLPVKIDPGQFEQVIVNLCVNARDAMPGGGKISISTKNIYIDKSFVSRHTDGKTGQYVCLTFSDNGCGMDQDTLSHIFEPFFTTKAKGKGTGLGLATIYGIIKQSDGHISVESYPGQGSQFYVYLPVAKENRASATGDSWDPFKELLGGSETILVVEDNPSVRMLVSSIVEGLGYNTLVASNGPEAIALARNFNKPIHLVITDIIMPNMYGTEAARQIKAIHKETKVLYMSGYSDQELLKEANVDLNQEFLEKPFNANILAERIRYLLDKP